MELETAPRAPWSEGLSEWMQRTNQLFPDKQTWRQQAGQLSPDEGEQTSAELFSDKDELNEFMQAAQDMPPDMMRSLAAVMLVVMPRLPSDHQQAFVASALDLPRHNLLQPEMAMSAAQGVVARQRQWHRMAGGRAGRPNFMLQAAGAGVGLIVGGVVGLAILAEGNFTAALGGLHPSLITGPAGMVLGAFATRFFRGLSGYHEAMMLVVVNERLSEITRERVTGQAEAWVPKTLLTWRAHEWHYANGRPYLWLQLPAETRIHDTLAGTLDYLMHPADLYQAADAAVYAQRSWNRMISDCALDFAEVDEGEESGEHPLTGMLPYLVPVAELVGSILIVILTSG